MKTDTPKSTKSKIVGAIAYVISFSLVYFAVQHFLFPSFDKEMIKSAAEMNKTCPRIIDEYTRLDSVTIPADKVIQYYYTLPDIERSEVNLDTVQKYIATGLIENVKSNPELKVYRKNKVTFNYHYNDKNGELAYKLSITPDIYSKE